MKRKVCEKMEMKMETKEKGEVMKEMQDTGCKMQDNSQLELIGNGQAANSTGLGNFPQSLFPSPYSLMVILILGFLIASSAAGIATAAGNGICGDVNEDEDVNMLDVIDLLYYVSYPGEYTIGSAWAADVNCDDNINMLDVIDLLYYVSYPGEYGLGCCES